MPVSSTFKNSTHHNIMTTSQIFLSMLWKWFSFEHVLHGLALLLPQQLSFLGSIQLATLARNGVRPWCWWGTYSSTQNSHVLQPECSRSKVSCHSFVCELGYHKAVVLGATCWVSRPCTPCQLIIMCSLTLKSLIGWSSVLDLYR